MLLITQDNAAGGTLTVGVSDNDLRFVSSYVDRYDRFQISTANPADVEVSLDRGTTFLSVAVALEDIHVAAAVGTRVLVTAANKVYRIAPGLRFTNFRIRQAGGTPVGNFQVLCLEPNE